MFKIPQKQLIEQFVKPMVIERKISDLRTKLAHGEAIPRKTADDLREAILGGNGQDGILTWIVRNIGP